MEILVIWTVVAIVAAIVATNKGRSGAGWFFLCLLLTPLALLVLLALPTLKPPEPQPVRLVGDVSDGPTKICPQCAENVKAAARICHFCGYKFPEDPASSSPPQNSGDDPELPARVKRWSNETRPISPKREGAPVVMDMDKNIPAKIWVPVLAVCGLPILALLMPNTVVEAFAVLGVFNLGLYFAIHAILARRFWLAGGCALGCLLMVGLITEATKTPEQRQAEAQARVEERAEQRQAEQRAALIAEGRRNMEETADAALAREAGTTPEVIHNMRQNFMATGVSDEGVNALIDGVSRQVKEDYPDMMENIRTDAATREEAERRLRAAEERLRRANRAVCGNDVC
jgi:hypothetical protein